MARFGLIFDFELKGKRSRAEPSQAENPSARALARASSARTHHYHLEIIFVESDMFEQNWIQLRRILNARVPKRPVF